LDTLDRIVFLREVATGPMSAVFAAERRGKSGCRPIAVKVLQRRFPRDAEMLFAMRDRARALARLGHRNIACVEDIAATGEFLALVSPWIDGLDLVDWVEILREREIALPARVVCDVLRGAAAALDAARLHVPPSADGPLGMVHRDLKPTNLLIARDGTTKVRDFGTGFTSLAGRNARAEALKKGLVKYMSPLRRDGKRGGPPEDIYSLGILAVELFRDRWLRRLRSHNPDHDRHLAEVVATLGPLDLGTEADDRTLRNLLLRMVAFDPDARPEAGEIVHTFRTLGDRAPGPSAESFAIAELLPLLPPMQAATRLELGRRAITLLDRPADAPDVDPFRVQAEAPTAPGRDEEPTEDTLEEFSRQRIPPGRTPPQSSRRGGRTWRPPPAGAAAAAESITAPLAHPARSAAPEEDTDDTLDDTTKALPRPAPPHGSPQRSRCWVPLAGVAALAVGALAVALAAAAATVALWFYAGS
jgi:serine/threonine-protein kinase